MARLADRLVPCDDSPSHLSRTVFVFCGAVITLAAPIAAAMFSLILATKAQEDEVVLTGYPEVFHTSAPLGVKLGAELRGERLGLDTVTTITVQAKPFVWGLVGICLACALCVLAGALFSAHSQYKEDNPGAGDDEEQARAAAEKVRHRGG